MLNASLNRSDAAVREVIAQVWKVDVANLDPQEMVNAVAEAMRDPANAERIWESLDDGQRGALQTLIGAKGKMSDKQFEMLYGKIRKMGRGQIQRENPLQNPNSIAESLYYRGLIFIGYENAETGAKPIVQVPPDLLAVLPTHRTTYDGLEDDLPPETPADVPYIDEAGPTIDALDPDSLDDMRQADTSLVDDMITLLAYVQTQDVTIERENDVLVFSLPDVQSLSAHLIIRDDERLSFLLEVAISADLVEVKDGHAFTRRAEARRWLEAKRGTQLKMLADAWQNSTVYRELWHVPGLHPEEGGWRYDPVVARSAVLGFMRDYVPRQEWWSLDEFIGIIKEAEPDFQRPGGDFESWYIRNDQGDYLTGFASWDAVEGALLEFYLMGPLHWLGMVDLAEDAARLNGYGRAFVTLQPLPDPNVPPEDITIQDDGTLLASRRVASIDRFQLARFTTWESPATRDGAPYTYRLTAQGIKQADAQGINTGHIAAFLSRLTDDGTLPAQISTLLDTWHSGATASATIEQLLVLRTTAPETLDRILDTPALRRYTGAKLGAMAVIVRADQWEALRDALGEHGIDVELL